MDIQKHFVKVLFCFLFFVLFLAGGGGHVLVLVRTRVVRPFGVLK